MKKKNVFLVFLLIASLCLFAACSGGADVTIDGGNGTDSNGGTTGPIHITVDFNLNIDAEEGKDANGFTWENNYSEITITGYIGASNELTVPKTINGKPVTQMKEGALKGFTGLKSIVIPGTIKTIEGVFEDCTGLETVTIEASGLENMNKAFKGCTSLKTVNVPATVKEMESAFEGCGSLNCDITIPEGITSLKKTFFGCASLKSIVIPESVTSLENAFAGCASLQSVRVPGAVTDVFNAFSGCSSLKNVEFLAQVTRMHFSFSGCTSLESFEIPNSVTELYGTFEGCSSLNNVEIPESVTRMVDSFKGCSSLQSIVIPGNVFEMSGSFKNCESLTEVTFADLTEELAGTYDAFNGCTSLKVLDLPVDCSFGGYGCIALEELTVRISGEWYSLSDIHVGYLPSLKKVNVLSDCEELDISSDCDYEDTYTQYIGTESWYHNMVAEAQRALTNEHGYRYYANKLDDGTECRELIGLYESSKWNAEPVPVTVKESRARVGYQVIYTCYGPALFGDDLTPGVVLTKSVITEYIWCVRPEVEENVCGAEYYEQCEYGQTIEVNGLEYLLKMDVNNDE